MVERIEFEITAKDKTSGQFRSTEKEVARLNKTVKAGGRGAKAATQSLKQLRQANAALGTTLKGDTNPSLKRTANELRRVEQASKSANRELANTGRAMGKGTARANAYTRAATRGVAALGFISPTAATASAQIVDLTASTGAATVAIATAAVAAIALGTALFGSVKAAVSFETSFRGIRKTVSATEEEYAKLAATNRELAKSLGENVNTINAIGQAAGQLGIAIGDLAKFEKIVIELASASDITARDASFSFGGLIKVLGLTIAELDSLTDQVVGLGNTFAATESEIVGLMNRIAGAGAVLKIPAQDLISISTAFAAVRVEQEAAGTAIQKVMLSMQRAAVVGGKELATFAAMLGITEQEFSRLLRSDPTKVFVDFVNALGRAGENAQLWLKELGLTDQRLTRTFLKLSSAGDLLNEALREGTEFYKEGTARTEEFDKALATTGGSLRKAGASIVDLGITVGDIFLPAVREAALGIAAFAEAINEGIGELRSWIDAIGDVAVALDNFIEKTPLIGKWLAGGGFFESEGFLRQQEAAENLTAAIADLTEEKQAMAAAGTQRLAFMGEFERYKLQAEIFREAVVGDTDAALELLAPGIAAGFEVLTVLFGEAGEQSSDLSSELTDNLTPGIEGVTAAADDARAALFSMFKAPTVEEAQAKLGLLGAQQELNDLKLLQREWTAAEKVRAEVLTNQVIPAWQALQKQARLDVDILEQQMILQQGELQTRDELTQAMQEGAKAAADLNTGLIQMPDSSEVLDATWVSLKRLVDEADVMTQREFNLIIAMLGEEEAFAALTKLRKWGMALSAEDFVLNVRVDGVEFALAQMRTLLAAGNALAITAVKFGALTASPAEMLAIAQSIRDATALMLPEIPTTIPPPDRGTGKAAAAAKKEIDPLKDGIITLAEALEFGFTAATAATAELEFAQGKLEARYFRVAVESVKLERAESKRQKQIEIGLRLAERDIERRKELIELQIEQAVQMGELRSMLAGTGLSGEIDTFRFALQTLGEELRQTGESALESFARLSAAATEAVQSQFDALFNRPTREQVALNLLLTTAELDRARLIGSGAPEEMLATIDDEIRQLQTLIDIRRREEDVVRARAAVADQGLLTQKEQFDEALLLTGLIAEESRLLDTLNGQIDKQYFALLGATRATYDFTSALQSAQSIIEMPLGTLRPSSGTAGGAASGTLNFEFNLRLESNEDTRRQIHEELDDQLDAAGLGGSNVGTGTYVP